MTMTLAQYKELRELGRLFEQGLAQPRDIRKLSELLTLINQTDASQDVIEKSFDPSQAIAEKH